MLRESQVPHVLDGVEPEELAAVLDFAVAAYDLLRLADYASGDARSRVVDMAPDVVLDGSEYLKAFPSDRGKGGKSSSA